MAKSTIQRYMREARPPHRSGQTWAPFLRNHGNDIWACDFLPVTDLLFRPLYAFIVIELGSRRIVHVGVTRHPTDAWVAQQLREATPFDQRPTYLIRDNDSKYGPTFSRVATTTGIEELRTAYRAPKENAICERCRGSVRWECLDHLLALSKAHLRRILKEYVAYFNRDRPHQGLQQRIPDAPEVAGNLSGIVHAGLGWAPSQLPTRCLTSTSWTIRPAQVRAMKRFKLPGHAQRFLSAFSGISPHFRPRRHRLTARHYREEMTRRFETWREVTGTAAA